MGTRLDEARARLLPVFRRGLDAKIRVLGRALAEHRRGDAEAERSIRRLSHQLRGSGSSYGLPAVSVAGAAVEEASGENLDVAVCALLRVLQSVARESPGEPTRVLFVDDDRELVGLVQAALGGVDCVILPADSIDMARSFLRTLSFDCVVLDLDLASDLGRAGDAQSDRDDGRDLLRELQRPAYVPVIVLSVSSSPSIKAECLALGAARYLDKPVDLDLLGVAITTLVEQTSLLREPEALDTVSRPPARPLEGPRVLMADDDPAMARLLEMVLEGEGYELVHCVDGGSALERAEAERFDLVILDRQMTPVDGFAALEGLRARPEYRAVPIVMLTGMGADEDIERAFALGADDYIEKPFRARGLRARLRRHLARASMSRRTG